MNYSTEEIQYFKSKIVKLISDHPKAYGHIIKSVKNKDIILFLDNMFPKLKDPFFKLNTKLYWLFHNLTDFPTCVCTDCLNKVLKNSIGLDKYPTHCSRECASRDPLTILKVKSTNLNRHGVACTLQTKLSWDAIHKAIIAKYGGTTGNIWGTEYGKKKCCGTKLKKNNGKFESEKTISLRKNTIIAKYGGTTGNIWGTDHGKASIKLTYNSKYGVDYMNQLPERRAKVSEYMTRSDVQKRINDTKRKNGTFNTSKPEEDAYALLCLKFGAIDVLRQFKSEHYPFACDFYIPSKKLYIECNYSWTHGGHFFNEHDPEDIKLLEKWKSKQSRFYDNAIDVWTRRDVLKMKTAQENSLNYLVFWDKKLFAAWIEGC